VPDGGSYYLVSQCSSAEEFVTSFRRYAENESLFIPTGEPLGVGLRGQFAVTLGDGQVMLEGKGEVTSASVRGAGLHGRAGMTIRFSDLDSLGRELLIHLARSRALSRPVPLPPTLKPRPLPGSVPSAKIAEARSRPRRSIATGPLDASAVMAECAIVPLDAPPPALVGDSAVPTRTEGSVSGPLPKPRTDVSQSGPLPKPRTDVSQSGPLPKPRTDVSQSGPLPKPRTEGSVSAKLPRPTGASSSPVRTETSQSGPLPRPVTLPTPPRTEGSVSAPLPRPTGTSSSPVRTDASQSGPLPKPRTDASQSGPLPTPPRTEGSVSQRLPRPPVTGAPPVSAAAPSKGAPERGTIKAAVAPPPVARLATPDRGWDDSDDGPTAEEAPVVPAVPAERSAPSSVPPSPSITPATAAATPRPMATPPQPTPAPTPPSDAATDDERGDKPNHRPSVPSLHASMGSSLAMAGAAAELGTLTPAPPPAAPPQEAAPSEIQPPTSVPGRPRGQSVPGRNPREIVSHRRAARLGKDTAEDNMISTWLDDGEEAAAHEVAAAELGRPDWTPLPQAGTGALRPSALHGSAAMPMSTSRAGDARPALPLPADGVPGEIAPETTDVVNLRRGGIPPVVRYLAIAAGVLVVGAVIAFAVSGRREAPVVGPAATVPEVAAKAPEPAPAAPAEPAPRPEASARTPAPPAGSAALTTATPPAEPAEPADGDDADDRVSGGETARPAAAVKSAGSGPCRAQFTSQPPGAEVVIGGRVIGSTPLDYAMACRPGVAVIRRDRYEPMQRKFTPRADGAKVVARLERPLYTVKLTSNPSGAIVTVGGRRIGKTPVTTKVPGYEKVAASFAKAGYATSTERVYAKRNGTVVAATLKKGGKRK
jgi:hypothetical protein